MLHITMFLKFCPSRNLTSGRDIGERNGQATPRDNVLLKISNGAPMSRWLTNGPDHKRNYSFSVWPDNVPTILCYFFAAVPSLKFP